MPSGKSGRRGRSVKRLVSTASVVGLPSRRKKPPGMRPAAYIFSSKSTLRGKKSSPSRMFFDMVAVASKSESPTRRVMAPPACSASLPVAMVS